MTTVTASLVLRIMGRFVLLFDPDLLVAGIAESRLFLAKEQAADETMRQVTGRALLLLDRLMDIALSEHVLHFRMTLHTFFCTGLFNRLFPGLHTGEECYGE